MVDDFLQGVMPPLTTPFTASGEVDDDALIGNIERYNPCGLSGYVVFGSNGEAVHLTADERRRILRLVGRTRATGMGLVAGINEQSTESARRAIDQAAEEGADVALVITPYFYKGSMEQAVLRQFFIDLADDSPLPLLIYNIPQNTGVTLVSETLAELSQHQRIIGCKDSSGNLAALASGVRACEEGFRLLVGNAAVFYPALAMGACGAILAVACAAPQPAVALYNALRRGDHDEARSLQDRLAPLGTLVTADLGIAGLKACLDLAGWSGGLPRRPLLPLSAESLHRLRQAMVVSGFYDGLATEA